MNIFIFTWNTQSVNYDETPSFISEIVDKITSSNCELVVIGLQEDSIRDSHLLNNPESMFVKALYGYKLLRIVEMSGWGITTYKAMKEDWEYKPRGLRLAVFKKDSCVEPIKVEHVELVCPGILDWITCGKGAVAINLVTNRGNITFLNMHLPFSSRSIIQDPVHKFSQRHAAVLWQAKCLRVLYDNTFEKFKPTQMFLFGDLNFRVQLRTELGASEIVQNIIDDPSYIRELYLEADELYLLSTYTYSSDSTGASLIPQLYEGIDNMGPEFIPTCKLTHGRTNLHNFKIGRYDQRTPSWCDRILYTAGNCIEYNSFDYAEMNLSDHAAVFGIYQI